MLQICKKKDIIEFSMDMLFLNVSAGTSQRLWPEYSAKVNRKNKPNRICHQPVFSARIFWFQVDVKLGGGSQECSLPLHIKLIAPDDLHTAEIDEDFKVEDNCASIGDGDGDGNLLNCPG